MTQKKLTCNICSADLSRVQLEEQDTANTRYGLEEYTVTCPNCGNVLWQSNGYGQTPEEWAGKTWFDHRGNVWTGAPKEEA